MPFQAGKGRLTRSKNIAYRLTGDFNTCAQPIYSWQKLKKRSLLLNSFTALRGGVVRTRFNQLRCRCGKKFMFNTLKSYIFALTLKISTCKFITVLIHHAKLTFKYTRLSRSPCYGTNTHGLRSLTHTCVTRIA